MLAAKVGLAPVLPAPVLSALVPFVPLLSAPVPHRSIHKSLPLEGVSARNSDEPFKWSVLCMLQILNKIYRHDCLYQVQNKYD